MSNESEIKRLADELDALVPEESALVDIQKSHKPAGNTIHGNERGLQRLGIELLRYSSDPIADKTDTPDSLQSDRLAYLSAHPMNRVVSIWRDEEIEKKTLEEFLDEQGLPRRVPLHRKLIAALGGLFVYGFFALAIYGAFELIQKLFY